MKTISSEQLQVTFWSHYIFVVTIIHVTSWNKTKDVLVFLKHKVLVKFQYKNKDRLYTTVSH